MGKYFIILKKKNRIFLPQVFKPSNSLDPPPMGRYFIILKFSKFFYHKYLNQVFPLTPMGTYFIIMKF